MKEPRSWIELKESLRENPERVKDKECVQKWIDSLAPARLSALLRLYPQTVPNNADEVTYFLFWNQRQKPLSTLPSHATVHEAISFGLKYRDTGFLVLTTCSIVTCLIQSSYYGKSREVERKVTEERNERGYEWQLPKQAREQGWV